MLDLPKRIRGISHPLVNELYLKTEQTDASHRESVLVIETCPRAHAEKHNTPGSSLFDLLNDLDALKQEVEQKIGLFDRIDIKSHINSHAPGQ